MLFTADHDEPRRALQKFIAAENVKWQKVISEAHIKIN